MFLYVSVFVVARNFIDHLCFKPLTGKHLPGQLLLNTLNDKTLMSEFTFELHSYKDHFSYLYFSYVRCCYMLCHCHSWILSEIIIAWTIPYFDTMINVLKCVIIALRNTFNILEDQFSMFVQLFNKLSYLFMCVLYCNFCCILYITSLSFIHL